jgi:type I restriction enzyme R subunit
MKVALLYDDWRKFEHERKEVDLIAIIDLEKLKYDEMQCFIVRSFRDGALKTTETDIDKILPLVSRFSEGGNRTEKKQGVIVKLRKFFEKFFGV